MSKLWQNRRFVQTAFVLLLSLCGGSVVAQPVTAPPGAIGVELSPEESESELPDAIFHSELRTSPLRKGRDQSEFSQPEQQLIVDNCKFGIPKVEQGADLGPVRIIVRDGYVLGHSSLSKIPYWVCEHSVPDELEGDGDRKKSKFLPDPQLSGQPRGELKDYKGSGYDRGHMHPAGNAKKSQRMMDETHFLSNIIPQVGPTFNQGIWAHLEDTVREWTEARGECWIISGPMFYDPLEEDDETADGLIPYFTIGVDEVAVPTHCFKIVLSKKGDGEWEMIAFVFENDRYAKPYDLAVHRATVDWVEKRTGFDFFPDLTDDVSPTGIAFVNQLEGKKSRMWETQ